MSHSIIIRGGGYVEGQDPPEGQVQAEIVWSPSHALTTAQQGKKVKKLLDLYTKMLNIESEPDE